MKTRRSENLGANFHTSILYNILRMVVGSHCLNCSFLNIWVVPHALQATAISLVGGLHQGRGGASRHILVTAHIIKSF
jgi:hypothetical protein